MKPTKPDKKAEPEPAGADVASALIKQKQLELELAIPKTLRTEFNFLKFPFFDLGRDSQRSKIEITESVQTQEGAFNILWRVTRNIESDFPGDFEKRVHRAVEQIVNATPKPIENPLRIGTVHYVAKLMGINADSGKNYQDIQRAFKNVVKTSVEAQGTFQLKESKSKRYISDTFHLYDRVIFRGEQLPNGKVADCIYLMLGSWYLQNINNNYVVPLDWRFYNQLQGSITTRMYEFLSIHFFTALERGQLHHEVLYSDICDYFPLVRQSPGWKARKQLKNAHDSLTGARYFERVEWIENIDPDDWVVRYWIGQRARDEYERNKAEMRQIGVGVRPVPLPERRRQRAVTDNGSQNGSSLKAQNTLLMRELVENWGMSQKTAQDLVKRNSERIREVLQWAAWAKKYKPDLIGKNPAGWIRKAVEESWRAPVGYEPEEVKQEREEKRAEALARQKEALEAERKEEEWRWWYTVTPEQRVAGDLLMWAVRYKRENGHEPSPEERKIKTEQLIAELPTLEQMQMRIFGRPKHPDQI